MSDMPELRAGPPWAMEEMILAEPDLVGPILANPAIAQAVDLLRAAEGPIVIAGCGTSEHAAMAGAALLHAATARDAFEASLDPQDGGVLIAVSHEGGTAATLAALRAAAARGARTIVITALPANLPDDIGDPLVIATPLRDSSWCHTVGYLSPLLAFAAISGVTDAATVTRLLHAGLAQRRRFADAAQTLHPAERLLIAAGGVDEVTARELALKIEEGLHVPVTPLGIEKILHGHLPAADAKTGVVILRADPHAQAARDTRADAVRAATAELDMPTVTIAALPTEPGLPATAQALLAGAIAAQLLTLELVHAAGTNPDLIRREEEPYRAAAAASGT